MAAWELAFNRHTDELMDDDDWRGWDKAFELVLLDPEIGLAEELWIADRPSYGPDFAAHVDAAYMKLQPE
jgi:hypothetical protein